MYFFGDVLIVISIAYISCNVFADQEPLVVENYVQEAATIDTTPTIRLTSSTEELVESSGQETNTNQISSGDGSSLDEANANASQNAENNSAQNATSHVGNTTKAKVTCKMRNFTDANVSSVEVQIVNGSTLLSTLQDKANLSATECIAVLFYAPWCNFSASAAPHYNALPRLFPNITCLAVDTLAYSGLCARFGIVAVPTILLFHNGHAVAKFNGTQYTVDKFTRFLNQYTGLEPIGPVNVTEEDYLGPLPSTPSDEIDFHLWLAWLFILTCCMYAFWRSSVCQQMIESIRNDWREAEAQHEHAE